MILRTNKSHRLGLEQSNTNDVASLLSPNQTSLNHLDLPLKTLLDTIKEENPFERLKFKTLITPHWDEEALSIRKMQVVFFFFNLELRYIYDYVRMWVIVFAYILFIKKIN